MVGWTWEKEVAWDCCSIGVTLPGWEMEDNLFEIETGNDIRISLLSEIPEISDTNQSPILNFSLKKETSRKQLLIGICLFKDFYRGVGPAGFEGGQLARFSG